ncbi:hypothetical protein BDZ89DRAFT_1066100 [Hymenopellis radicata]|nr:hypothetical protein BDZ89DRAFT_1066100 [Hymenopellis radicata]
MKFKWPEITWASDYNPDGSRRHPNPNSVHGWLAKWRGTFSGDERLRSRGIREIKASEALERRRQRKARKGSGGFLSSLFGRRKSKPATSTRGSSGRGRQPSSRQATSTRRPAPPHRRSTNASKQSKHSQRSGAGSGHRPSQQQRPNNVRRTTTRRSGR